MASDWTRKADAMLEPNFSAWMITAASARTSSTPVRMPRSRSTSRAGPAHLELEVGDGKLLADHRARLGQLAGDPAHRRVEPQARLDAHDHQVERIGQAQKDRLRRAASCAARRSDRAGRTPSRLHLPRRCNVICVMPEFEDAGWKCRGQPDQEPDELDPVEDGDRLLLAEAGVQQLEPDLAQLLRVGGAQRLAQLAGGRGDLGLKHSCRLARLASAVCRGPRRSSRRRSRSSAVCGRAAAMPRIAQAPSVIARKTAIGISVSLLGIMTLHTLIATIFLITQAPINWPHGRDRSAS